MENKVTSSFPSIKSLLSESWVTFKKSVLSLLFLNIFNGAVIFTLVLIGVIVLIMQIGGFAGLKMLSSGQLDPKTLLSSSFVLPLVVICVVFLLAIIVVSSIGQIASILFVGHADERPNFALIIRQSLTFIIPLISVSFFTSVLSFGALFFFVLPAFIFAFFFLFITYELVLGGKRGLEAVRGSVQIISQNLGDILVRWILFVLAYLVIVVFLPNILIKLERNIGSLIKNLSFIINTLVGWYGVSYWITLYKQASARTDRNKKVNITWMWIIAFFGWLIFSGIVYVGIKALSSESLRSAIQQTIQKSLKNQNVDNKVSDTLITQDKADRIAFETFEAVNRSREENNLDSLEEDNRLCAYAQRRLTQLNQMGKFDDNKGFYEDFANNELKQSFFADFQYVNQDVWLNLAEGTDPDAIVERWVTDDYSKTESNPIQSAEYTHACVRATPQYLIMISATQK